MGHKRWFYSLIFLLLFFAADANAKVLAPGGVDIDGACIAEDSGRVFADLDGDGIKGVGEEYLDQAVSSVAEINALETIITGILDGEIFVGDGADSGTFRTLVDNDIPDDITITETDPNALLTADTDNVKDTHIDFGTGTNQVSSADIPDHDGHTIRDAFAHIVNRGVVDDITITLTGGLGFEWSSTEISDVANYDFIIVDAGSGTATDNAVNYLKWVSGTTLTVSTVAPTGDEVLVATGSVYDGNINSYRTTSQMDSSIANGRRGLRVLFPNRIISGMEVGEDTDATNPLDLVMSAGVLWKEAMEEKTPIEIKSRNTAMVRHFHTSGAWDSDTNAEIDTANYDNGTNLVSIPLNKYVKCLTIYMNGKIGFVYPTTYWNNAADALDAPLPATPPGLEPVPKLTAIIYKQGDADFTTAIWQDVRPGISEESFNSVTDLDQLAGLRSGSYWAMTSSEGTELSEWIDSVVLSTDGGLALGENINITLGTETIDHDGTDFVLSDSLKVAGTITAPSLLSSSGTFTLGGTGNTNNENETSDYETTSNFIWGDSTTGVTGRNWDGDYMVGLGTRARPTKGADDIIYAYSNDSTNVLDYIKMYHDKTDAQIDWASGELHLGDSVAGDIVLFGGEDVGDGEDGKYFRVKRMANEGDTNFGMVINSYGNANFVASGYGAHMTFNASSGDSRCGFIGLEYNFNQYGNTTNAPIKQYGYITAGTARKYIQWQVNDTTDNFELTRQDSNILGFDIQMPLITDGQTVSGDINPEADGTRDLGTQTTAQWANVWADLVNGADYSYLNGWRTLESEKYYGYPKGIAFGNKYFVDGKATDTVEGTPVFVVTEEFIEYQGARLTPGGFKFICWLSNFIGKMFN